MALVFGIEESSEGRVELSLVRLGKAIGDSHTCQYISCECTIDREAHAISLCFWFA